MNKYKVFSYKLDLKEYITLDEVLDNFLDIDAIGVISPFCYDRFNF